MTPPELTTDGTARRARAALWLPIFDELADPRTVAGLAADAEAAGWDGVFVWDHLRWRAPVVEVADPWITLAAVATATEALRFGPMVSPLARRRPAKVARETVTLDRLSGDDGSWYRMNRTFLTELRKQFLQWRSLSPQKMLQYVEESRKLFAAPEGASA